MNLPLIFIFCLLGKATHSASILKNGYSGILAAGSDDFSQLPGDSVFSAFSKRLVDFPDQSINSHVGRNDPQSGLRAVPYVIYFAVDTSVPVGNNPLSTVKTSVSNLLNNFLSAQSSGKFAVSSFVGSDTGTGTYLKEALAPTALSQTSTIISAVNSLTTNTDVFIRDVGAAMRDAIEKLSTYKDQGGSILYLVTACETDSSVLELDVIQGLLTNNIQLVAVESGGTRNSLLNLHWLAKARYYSTASYGSPSFFTLVNREIQRLYQQNPLVIDRTIVFSKNNVFPSGSSWDGNFWVGSALGTGSAVAFHSPLKGLVSVTIQGPDGSIYTATNNPSDTNWNSPTASTGLVITNISYYDGDWRFRVEYDSSSCSDCDSSASVTLQVTSSLFIGIRTTTTTPFIQNEFKAADTKVVYFAVDTSYPVGNNPIAIVKRAVNTLVTSVLPRDTYFAVSSFEGPDTGLGSYLKEKVALTQLSVGQSSIVSAIDALANSFSVFNCDVGAAIRDAIDKLKPYKDQDGSILYLVTAIGSDAASVTLELDIAQSLIDNRIQLVVAEAGNEATGFSQKSLSRLSQLTNGLYYHTASWSTNFFSSIHQDIYSIVQDPIETGRRGLLYQKDSYIGTNIIGDFTVEETNLNNIVALQSPFGEDITVLLTSPGGTQLSLTSNGQSTNWNVPGSVVGFKSLILDNPPEVGRWTFEISGPGTGEIVLQVTTTLG